MLGERFERANRSTTAAPVGTPARQTGAGSASAPTVRRLLVRTSAGLQEVRRFHGSTADGEVLSWQPATPAAGVVAIRVETDSSPSFVAWKEIEVVG